MSRIPAIDPARADQQQKPLLDAVQKQLGRTPNMMRVLANSPAALRGYLDLGQALASGVLPPKVREQIALTVGEVNQCDYCLSAHTAIGGMVGLKPQQVAGGRAAGADDPKVDAILKLARTLVVQRGHASDQDLAVARKAGASDAEVIETTAHVALNILTNYTNHVAQTVVDFPAVSAAAAGAR